MNFFDKWLLPGDKDQAENKTPMTASANIKILKEFATVVFIKIEEFTVVLGDRKLSCTYCTVNTTVRFPSSDCAFARALPMAGYHKCRVY